MSNIKKYKDWLSEDSDLTGTIVGDSIDSIIDAWEDKPFNDYTLEKGKVFINTQEGGDLENKYQELQSYLKTFGIESEIKDIGWKTNTKALVFNPEQLVDSKIDEHMISGIPGGTKDAEYRRSIELFEQILKEKGMFYAIALWYDSGYDRKDLLGMMKVLKPGKGRIKKEE